MRKSQLLSSRPHKMSRILTIHLDSLLVVSILLSRIPYIASSILEKVSLRSLAPKTRRGHFSPKSVYLLIQMFGFWQHHQSNDLLDDQERPIASLSSRSLDSLTADHDCQCSFEQRFLQYAFSSDHYMENITGQRVRPTKHTWMYRIHQNVFNSR
jgi:hypothetical protein